METIIFLLALVAMVGFIVDVIVSYRRWSRLVDQIREKNRLDYKAKK